MGAMGFQEFLFTAPWVIRSFYSPLLLRSSYRENNQLLRLGMGAIGFQEYLKPEDAGYIVTTFHYPKSSKFNFEEFCNKLSDKGKISTAMDY